MKVNGIKLPHNIILEFKEFFQGFLMNHKDVITSPDDGLCKNLYMFVGEYSWNTCTDFIGEVAKSWKEWSGSELFPIPETEENGVIYGVGNYEGEGLRLRRSLAQHILVIIRHEEDSPCN